MPYTICRLAEVNNLVATCRRVRMQWLATGPSTQSLPGMEVSLLTSVDPTYLGRVISSPLVRVVMGQSHIPRRRFQAVCSGLIRVHSRSPHRASGIAQLKAQALDPGISMPTLAYRRILRFRNRRDYSSVPTS